MTAERRRSPGFWLLFAAIALVYLYFIPYFPALNNPNENSRVYQIRAAVELHKLSVNEQIARYGMVNDLAKRDGLFYAGKAPGTTFIGVPIYAALRSIEAAATGNPDPAVSSFRLLYALRLLGTIFPALAFIIAFRRFLKRHIAEGPVSDALTAALALGSMFLPYALIYVNHSLSAATAFSAIIATDAGARWLDRSSPTEKGAARRGLAWIALAGFFAAMSAALDYALFPVAVALLLYAALKTRVRPLSLALLCVGAAIPSIATAAYHTICWGGPFKLSTSFLANPEFAANTSRGLFGIIGMTRASLSGVLISPSKGILYFAPIFALAIVGAVAACARAKRRGLAVLCAAITLWMIIYSASLVNWDAGWTVGPRYMTVIIPFALAGMGLAWRSLGPRAKALILPVGIGLTIASIVFMTATSVVFPHLQPEYKNPIFEVIWPLWRDGITPHSLAHDALGLTGRAVQAPFLVILGAILLYLIWAASGASLEPRPGLARRLASSITAVLVASLFVWAASIPRTASARTVDAGRSYLRGRIWEPPLPADNRAAPPSHR